MRYFSSVDVISPKRNIKSIVPIYQNSEFALAKVTWNGTERIAIRWNVTENEWTNPDKISGKTICLGEPNSRGYPTWFVLPENFLKLLIDGSPLADDIKNILLDLKN
jgi:hypothetical protein